MNDIVKKIMSLMIGLFGLVLIFIILGLTGLDALKLTGELTIAVALISVIVSP